MNVFLIWALHLCISLLCELIGGNWSYMKVMRHLFLVLHIFLQKKKYTNIH